MKIQQFRWNRQQKWQPRPPEAQSGAHLVFLFGETEVLKTEEPIAQLKAAYPNAHFLGCSTAGEIYDTQVTDDSLVATAIEFEKTHIRTHCVALTETENSFQAGLRLAEAFESDNLVHLFVLSDGLQINGSELIHGLEQALPPQVTITGGLAGDGSRFQETLVLWNDYLGQGLLAAVGLYSDRLQVGYGSLGGWVPFGPHRQITRAQGNVLYELDGQSALALYKKYLGDYASGLPATGLLFPLSLYDASGNRSIVRTILAIDEATQSLTFAGDLPEGYQVQLMQTNFDRLVEGATAAAQISLARTPTPELAVLVSCVGRKLVLKQRVEEEVEGVRDILGPATVLTGFYSYGEIAPVSVGESCKLHNQTMTITTFCEL